MLVTCFRHACVRFILLIFLKMFLFFVKAAAQHPIWRSAIANPRQWCFMYCFYGNKWIIVKEKRSVLVSILQWPQMRTMNLPGFDLQNYRPCLTTWSCVSLELCSLVDSLFIDICAYIRCSICGNTVRDGRIAETSTNMMCVAFFVCGRISIQFQSESSKNIPQCYLLAKIWCYFTEILCCNLSHWYFNYHKNQKSIPTAQSVRHSSE
jgi:hypothetical protein